MRWYRACVCCRIHFHKDEMIRVPGPKVGGHPSHRWKAIRCIERERENDLWSEHFLRALALPRP